jgi:secreted trypsin-like serine protease
LQIILGVDDLQKAERPYGVKRVVRYPGLDSSVFQKDQIGTNLALIELDRDWRGPIVTVSTGQKFDPTDASAARIGGFGHFAEGMSPVSEFRDASERKFRAANSRLREVTLPIVSTNQCVATYDARRITQAKLCAGFAKGGADACVGNSGAPLIIKTEKGCSYQVGVVSWGAGCGKPGQYGVYERVSASVGWLRQFVRDLQVTSDDYAADCKADGGRVR